jgi:A/G-specific adenine glycosylase
MELGATVCLPNGAPKCDACPLRAHCRARIEDKTTVLPVREKAVSRKIQPKTVLILRQNDTVLLRRRDAVGLLAGMFEPLTLEGKMSAEEIEALLNEMGSEVKIPDKPASVIR